MPISVKLDTYEESRQPTPGGRVAPNDKHLPPEDREPPGPYGHATGINTDPKWMLDPKTKAPIMGEGVEANTSDLTQYAGALDQIQQNFNDLSHAVLGPMEHMISAAFPGGMENGLLWTQHFFRVSGHNAGQLQQFLGNMAFGLHNVASAAQVVADAYRNTDETSAATLNSVLFAFGDLDKAPGTLPQQYLDHVKTWDKFREEHPEQTTVIPTLGVRPEDIHSETVGNTTTTIVKLPDGGTYTIITETYSTYSGGPSGYTETVLINGKPQTVRTSSSSVNGTTVESYQIVYDEHGTEVRRQVTSREHTSTTVVGSTAQTDRQTTTYTYDSDGNQTNESSTQSSEAVGAEHYYEPAAQPGDDPVDQELAKMRPEANEPIILAPGAPGDHPGGAQAPSGPVSV